MAPCRTSRFVIVCLLALPVPALAQPPAASIDQLRVLVRPGETVKVLDRSGRETRGVVENLDDAHLTLRAASTTRVFDESEIERVRMRVDDPLTNGARNGFIAGAIFGAMATAAWAGEYGNVLPVVVIEAALFGGIGAGVGVGIDAMITTDRVVYQARRRAAGVRLSPMLSADRKGLGVSIGF